MLKLSAPSAMHSARPAARLWRGVRATTVALRAGGNPWAPARPQQARRTAAPAAAAAEPQALAAEQSAPAAAGCGTAPPLSGSLQLYNTLSRSKEVFRPRADQGKKVSMYVCGVTVYDYSHIGHARVYVAFDVLYRTLGALGYDVTYVRNFTDIDDKIIARANQLGEDPLALSRRFIDEFHTDMVALACLPPAVEPKATDYIPQMIAMIQDIIKNGHGYVVGGDVYFEVATLPGYGALSGRSQEDNRAGERVAADERKRGPADFALWKAAKPGEPTWESPWGPGRPGWHIECSAMIKEVMGPTIDIHGGGRDLVFPHHENELAQSRGAAAPCSCGADHPHPHNGRGQGASEPAFVRYWVHNGFVNVDSEKMSKSLGNFFTIREVLALYHPAALRWFLVGSQYRAPVNYTLRALEEASDRVYYLYQALADAADALSSSPDGQAALAEAQAQPAPAQGQVQLLGEVEAALLDDLNTPAAVAALSAPLKALNDLLHTKKGKKQAGRLQDIAGTVEALRAALRLLGLLPEDPATALAELRQLALIRSGLSEEEVAAAIAERAEARAAKDFAAADAVRLRLEAAGVLIMDTPQGTTWKPGPRLELGEEGPAAGA